VPTIADGYTRLTGASWWYRGDVTDIPQPQQPVPCPECGAAMERTTLPRAADEKQDRTRLICPRCGHEVRE
jgi:predicted RNA-binding Zn-ribbon protein involved in translation (DUF1610 family)